MKRYWHISFFIVSLFFSAQVAAQGSGNVVMHTDPRLSVLVRKERAEVHAAEIKAIRHKAEARTPANTPAITDTHIPGNDSGPMASAATVSSSHAIAAAPETAKKPVVDAAHEVREVTHAPLRIPVHIHEKEGRIIYAGKGYRVQIYSGSDREKAIEVKTEFMRQFPAVRTYLTYVSPSFRVKVGNYRNRTDAMGMLRQAKGIYSTPCVIVPDIITINSF